MEAKTKWNGNINQTIKFIDEWIGQYDQMYHYAMFTDCIFEQKDVNDLAEAAKKLNKIVKYCVESGRISKEKAQEILGENVDIQEITNVGRGKPIERWGVSVDCE